MMPPYLKARPVTTRSAVVLEIARELAGDNAWPLQQALVTMRPQGGGPRSVTLFGSDSPDAIEQVANGTVQLAMVNPAEPLTLAVRGTGPFKEPLPLRAIAVIPSYDQFAFAVSEKTGIRSLEELRDKRYPLRVSLRGQRDHGVHFFERVILGELGFSLQDIESWGGQVRYDAGLPDGMSTSGSEVKTSRLEMARNGEVDAIFDEAVVVWVNEVIDLGFRVLQLQEGFVHRLEAMGFRRGIIAKEVYPNLPHDVLTLDFSGWPIYTHANVADEVVSSMCAALERRKANIPWDGEGPLPLEVMCKDTHAGPLDVQLHPAAERYWRKLGYL
jgi:TRAP-type uncharacterized transport system substrate-binding protein